MSSIIDFLVDWLLLNLLAHVPFGLGAAGADPRLAAAQRNSGLLAQKIVQRAAVEALQRRPEGEVREVVVD